MVKGVKEEMPKASAGCGGSAAAEEEDGLLVGPSVPGPLLGKVVEAGSLSFDLARVSRVLLLDPVERTLAAPGLVAGAGGPVAAAAVEVIGALSGAGPDLLLLADVFLLLPSPLARPET